MTSDTTRTDTWLNAGDAHYMMGEHCRQLERELTSQRLAFKAAFEMPHIWHGDCPDANVGMDSRDPTCPACRALMAVMS